MIGYYKDPLCEQRYCGRFATLQMPARVFVTGDMAGENRRGLCR